jgi:hypothetical protein
MEKYWQNCPRSSTITTPSTPTNDADITTTTTTSPSVMSDFDRYHRTLVANEEDEGWQSELRRYLKDMPADVTVETDIICYWQVCHFFLFYSNFKLKRSHITAPCRTITESILFLDASHWTSFQFLRLLFLVSISFRPPRKLQMIITVTTSDSSDSCRDYQQSCQGRSVFL